MEPEYQNNHKFEFFSVDTKQKFSWREAALTFSCFGLFISSLILPCAYFANYKTAMSDNTSYKNAEVMKCDTNKSEIICYTEKMTFQHTD